MANHLRNLITKELREIFRDPRLFIGMIIVPVVMFPLMGSAIRVSVEATSNELQKINVGMMDLDRNDSNHTLSDLYIYVMTKDNFTITNVYATDVQSGINWCIDHGIKTFIVIPENFTENIVVGKSSTIQIYQVLQRFDLSEATSTTLVTNTVSTFNSAIVADRLSRQYPNSTASNLLTPVLTDSMSVVHGNIENTPPSTVVTTLMTSSIVMPIMIMLLIIMAGQLAATSVAMEKEQKTLEVLLTLPIKRVYILFGKIAGVVVVALIATIAYVAGFTYYMQSIMSGKTQQGTDLSAMGLTPDIVGYSLMAVSLFFAFLAALSIAVMIAAYTKDVRSAQSLMGVLYIPIFVPAIILMFASIDILPISVQAVMYAIPFTYPTLAAKAIYTHEYTPVLFGIVYQAIFTIVVLSIAARFYDSERVLTAKFEFGKGKKKKVAD